MKTAIIGVACLLTSVASASPEYWLSSVTINSPDLRRAFLAGMSYDLDNAGGEMFWPSEAKKAEVYDAVAKQYAKDIGASLDAKDSDRWRAPVAHQLHDYYAIEKLLNGKDIGLSAAFLAGAYVRWGTPTGYKVTGYSLGYRIAENISRLGDFDVQLVHHVGYPGGMTITITGSDETPTSAFFALMGKIVGSISSSPNQSSEPTLSSVTPPAGQESRPR
jgi:hypothetical protein